MVRDESDAILDDLLSRFHAWMRGYRVCPEPGADPAFRNAKSGRGWDSTQEILDGDLRATQMKAIEFCVSGDRLGHGGMQEPHRTAIYVNARNCYTGRAVWLSPRLPQDPEVRALIVLEARTELMRRLLKVGVM